MVPLPVGAENLRYLGRCLADAAGSDCLQHADERGQRDREAGHPGHRVVASFRSSARSAAVIPAALRLR
jgi:hypothetical protein